MLNRLRLGALWSLGYACAILVSWIIVAPAYAAVTLGPQAWNRYAGTRIVAGPFASLEECAATADDGNTCRVSVRITVTSDPQVCPHQPAAERQEQLCPAGTTGSWSQSRSYVSASYPTCWTAGPWIPQEAPIGACVEPPPPSEWTHCANQGERCEFRGTRIVRYGIDSRWAERTLTDGVQCDNVAFGNPASGALKTCQLRGAAEPPPPPPPPATGSTLLQWTAPTHNDDGSPLTDLAGYRIRYGRSETALDQMLEIAPATTHRVQGLASDAWFFTVSAVNGNGAESAPSNVAPKMIP